MKRTPRKPTKLRKQSKLPLRTLLTRADRALQDWYRREWQGLSCEVCSRPFDLMHHFIPKSQSARLRFEDTNLVPLCHGCHFRLHNTGDPNIEATILKFRGWKWYDNLKLLRRKSIQLDRPYLDKQLTKYK